MKYRVIDDGQDELTILTEDGGLGSIRMTDEIEEGDGRQSVIEWYDQSFLEILQSQLPQVIACPVEDLPKYLNIQDELVQQVLKQRLTGDPVDSLFCYIYEWMSNNAAEYYEDSIHPYKNPDHIKVLYEELAGNFSTAERDDSLFKEHLN